MSNYIQTITNSLTGLISELSSNPSLVSAKSRGGFYQK